MGFKLRSPPHPLFFALSDSQPPFWIVETRPGHHISALESKTIISFDLGNISSLDTTQGDTGLLAVAFYCCLMLNLWPIQILFTSAKPDIDILYLVHLLSPPLSAEPYISQQTKLDG